MFDDFIYDFVIFNKGNNSGIEIQEICLDGRMTKLI